MEQLEALLDIFPFLLRPLSSAANKKNNKTNNITLTTLTFYSPSPFITPFLSSTSRTPLPPKIYTAIPLPSHQGTIRGRRGCGGQEVNLCHASPSVERLTCDLCLQSLFLPHFSSLSSFFLSCSPLVLALFYVSWAAAFSIFHARSFCFHPFHYSFFFRIFSDLMLCGFIFSFFSILIPSSTLFLPPFSNLLLRQSFFFFSSLCVFLLPLSLLCHSFGTIITVSVSLSLYLVFFLFTSLFPIT